jgi:hypothetical protein
LQRQIITPGPALVEAGRALESPQRLLGRYPYQWLQPGPHSKPVRAAGSVSIPDGYGQPSVILTYQVPQGERFSLRALVMDSNSPDWTEGSGDLVFSLMVTTIGARPVDYFGSVNTRLGNSALPWPLYDGRLEFQSLDVLQMSVTAVSGITLGAGFAFGMLIGHTYPNSEAA